MQSVALPPKRDVVMYSRITEDNKRFLEDYAAKVDVSQAALIEHIINYFRANVDSNKRKSGKRH